MARFCQITLRTKNRKFGEPPHGEHSKKPRLSEYELAHALLGLTRSVAKPLVQIKFINPITYEKSHHLLQAGDILIEMSSYDETKPGHAMIWAGNGDSSASVVHMKSTRKISGCLEESLNIGKITKKKYQIFTCKNSSLLQKSLAIARSFSVLRDSEYFNAYLEFQGFQSSEVMNSIDLPNPFGKDRLAIAEKFPNQPRDQSSLYRNLRTW